MKYFLIYLCLYFISCSIHKNKIDYQNVLYNKYQFDQKRNWTNINSSYKKKVNEGQIWDKIKGNYIND